MQLQEDLATMESKPNEVLSVSVLGGMTASLGGREVPIVNKKGKALLGYLAFTPSHSETRERLVGLFWSEMSEDKARANLRQTLRTLRDTLTAAGFTGFNALYSDPGFQPGSVRFDVDQILESIAADAPLPVLLDKERIADSLLEGFEDVDPAFRGWLLVERENLSRRLIRDLQDRLIATKAANTPSRRLAEALLMLDPTHEPACQAVMRACAQAGDQAGAISVYNRFCEILDQQHDQPPSDATVALLAEIKNGTLVARDTGILSLVPRAETSPGIAGPNTWQRPSEKLVLIIGSFQKFAGRQELAFAFRHELISRLMKFREWLVVDGEPATPPDPAGPPCYVLSAPMMEADNAINLMLSLKDARSGEMVWNESFNVELNNLFASLREVVRQIAAQLNVYISVERMNRFVAAPDVSLDIYDRWLRGQWLIQQWLPENRERARKIFQSITVEAPHFSPALSSLAQMDNADHIVLAGTYRTLAVHQRSLEYARNAVKYDPYDSRAHLALAWSHAFAGSPDAASSHFEQALALNPDDSWTATSTALGHAFGDDIAKATASLEKAKRLTLTPTPLHWCYFSNVSFICEDFESALSAAELSGDMVANLAGWRAATLALLDRTREAEVEAQRFVGLIRNVWRGETEPTAVAVVRWFLHCFPFRGSRPVDLLRRGLAKAGLPAA